MKTTMVLHRSKPYHSNRACHVSASWFLYDYLWQLLVIHWGWHLWSQLVQSATCVCWWPEIALRLWRSMKKNHLQKWVDMFFYELWSVLFQGWWSESPLEGRALRFYNIHQQFHNLVSNYYLFLAWYWFSI